MGGRTYPARLAEATLKERVERHGVFPTTGQTAICKRHRNAACGNYGPNTSYHALGLTVPGYLLQASDMPRISCFAPFHHASQL